MGQLPEPGHHTEVGHDVIAAELVACTLGARGRAGRPELRTDMLTVLNRALAPALDALRAWARGFRLDA